MRAALPALLFSSLLLPACVDEPVDEIPDEPNDNSAIDLPESGNAHVWTPNGVLPVAYQRVGDHVVFQDDMMTSVASFKRAMLDAAELEGVLAGNADTVRGASRALGRYRWPGGVVRWRQGAGISGPQRTAFLNA